MLDICPWHCCLSQTYLNNIRSSACELVIIQMYRNISNLEWVESSNPKLYKYIYYFCMGTFLLTIQIISRGNKASFKMSHIDGSTGIIKMWGALVITKETYMNVITGGKQSFHYYNITRLWKLLADINNQNQQKYFEWRP